MFLTIASYLPKVRIKTKTIGDKINSNNPFQLDWLVLFLRNIFSCNEQAYSLQI